LTCPAPSRCPGRFPKAGVVGALFNGGYDLGRAREAAEEALRYVGLYDKRHELAGRLTFNELRLLELARALAGNPKLLLLDEVMAGLTPREIDALVQLIKKLAEERGVAAISLVEHRMRAVAQLAHRVIVMHQGKIIAEGPPEKALNDPKVVEVYLGGHGAERSEPLLRLREVTCAVWHQPGGAG
jgi:branched-chain amino acid transport system ATP-binding protein